MTQVLSFPNSTSLVERLKARRTIVFLFSTGSSLLPPGFRLLLQLGCVLMETCSLNAIMHFSFRLTFTRALITLYFAVEWNVRPGLIYFRKSILTTRCVENLLNFAQVWRIYSVDMIL